MKDFQVYTRLRSMGMTCFVKYFHDFTNESLSRHDLIEMLARKENYTPDACATRVSNARSIIRAGGAKVALRLIIQANKVPRHIGDEASKLCDNLP